MSLGLSVTFYQLILVVTSVMHEVDNACSIRSTWLCYWLVRFLVTAYICNNYYRFCRTLLILLDMSFSLSLHFLSVLSLQTSVCSTLKFYPVFSGVIMSIRSFFLFSLAFKGISPLFGTKWGILFKMLAALKVC